MSATVVDTPVTEAPAGKSESKKNSDKKKKKNKGKRTDNIRQRSYLKKIGKEIIPSAGDEGKPLRYGEAALTSMNSALNTFATELILEAVSIMDMAQKRKMGAEHIFAAAHMLYPQLFEEKLPGGDVTRCDAFMQSCLDPYESDSEEGEEGEEEAGEGADVQVTAMDTTSA